MFSEKIEIDLFDEQKRWSVFKRQYDLNYTFYSEWLQLTDAIPDHGISAILINVDINESLTVKCHHIIQDCLNKQVKQKGVIINFGIKSNVENKPYKMAENISSITNTCLQYFQYYKIYFL